MPIPTTMVCETCGLSILHRFYDGVKRWMATPHHAPAGPKCIGGGVPIGEPFFIRTAPEE